MPFTAANPPQFRAAFPQPPRPCPPNQPASTHPHLFQESQTTPYGENPKLAQFDRTGARAALDPIAETCNWIIDPAELAEQGEREARERQARERAQEAERERILNDLIGTPFPAGDVSSIGSVGGLTSAGGGLPEHVRRAYFESGVSVARVTRARNTEEEIVCPRGEWNTDGTDDGITLRDCSLR